MATEVASGTVKFPVICEDVEINPEARHQVPTFSLLAVALFDLQIIADTQ